MSKGPKSKERTGITTHLSFKRYLVNNNYNSNNNNNNTLIEYVLICIGRNTIHMYDKYGPIFIQ